MVFLHLLLCVLCSPPVVIPMSSPVLGNVLNPAGTLFISWDFGSDTRQASDGSETHPGFVWIMAAIKAVRNQQLTGVRPINMVVEDDTGNPVLGSRNMMAFVTRAQQNRSQYGDVVGVVTTVGTITPQLAITSGSLQLAHSCSVAGFDLLNRATYPYTISSLPSDARKADAMMVLATSYGWRSMSLLCALDASGRAFRDYVINTYSAYFTIDQQTFSPNPVDRDATMATALRNIQNNDNRIILISASGIYAYTMYQALYAAGIIDDPRYIIIGDTWSAFTPPTLAGTGIAYSNVVSVMPSPPSSDAVSTFLPMIEQTLIDLNMTSIQRSTIINLIPQNVPYLPSFYNQFFAMFYAAARLWNTSTPLTGPAVYDIMSKIDTTTFGTKTKYYQGFVQADIAITTFNTTTKTFTQSLLYTGVTALVNSSVSARSQFVTVKPLLFMDGTTTPPPDRPVYSLTLAPTGSITPTQTKIPDGTTSNNNNNNMTFTMESGNRLPNRGYQVLISDQTGLIIPRQTIALWTTALNGNPTINAYVTNAIVGASINATTGTSATVSGTPSVKLTSTSAFAIADFSDLILSARPGSTVYLHFECILPGGRPLTSQVITINMNDCQAGNYIDSKANICQPCADGYDTKGEKNALTCVPVLHEISTGVTTAFIVLASIGIAISAVVFGYVVKLTMGHSRTIYHYSPTFCMITLCGMAFVFASVIGMVINPVSSCTAQSVATWLFNIGFTWTFGSMFAKSFRLFKIFNNILLYMTAISNKQLYSMLAGLTAVDIILLAIWQGVDPYTLNVGSYRTCDTGTVGSAIKYTLIVIKGSLLLCGMYLTHRTRHVPSAFNEHKASTIGIYNASVIGVVILGIWFGMKSTSGDVTISIVQAAGAWIGALSTLCVIFGHLLYDVYLKTTPSSQGKGPNQNLSNLQLASGAVGDVLGGVGVFSDRHSSAHFSSLEGLAAEINSRNAAAHGDKAFLESYAKLQAVMKTLGVNQQKKNVILQQLAEICADKDYRRRCGVDSAVELSQAGYAPAPSDVRRRSSAKDGLSGADSIPRDRKPSQSELLPQEAHRSSLTLPTGSPVTVNVPVTDTAPVVSVANSPSLGHIGTQSHHSTHSARQIPHTQQQHITHNNQI